MLGFWELILIGLLLGFIVVPYVRKKVKAEEQRRFSKEDIVELEEGSYEIEDE